MRVVRLALVAVAGLWSAGCREKWHSWTEFDTKVLEEHAGRLPRDYDLAEAHRVAGAYVAHVASGGANRGEFEMFDPYSACVDRNETKTRFRFLDNTFSGGWIDVAARLTIEFETGTRLLFCFDSMVVNITRFPCFRCPGDKYVPVKALNGMRALCGERPVEATGPFAQTPSDHSYLERHRACYVAP